MTMQCDVIRSNAVGQWNAELGEVEWSGENTMFLHAKDDITDEEQELTVSFQPWMLDASPGITQVVGMNDGSNPNYMQNYNNMWWACAVCVNEWPTSVFVPNEGQLEVHFNGQIVAYISADAELTSAE